MSAASVTCACGCGQPTPLAPRTHTRLGWVKGEPLPLMPGHRRGVPVDRYRVDEESGCWVWQRSVYRNGYGNAGRSNGTRLAHRLIYEEQRGLIPAGMQLDHLCGNRRCVNPDHLEPVDNATNSQRGTKARLTPEAVREIRRSTEPLQVLADRYGVKRLAISRVRSGTRWANVA